MRITPLDIYQQEFKKVLRGVDPDEVEDFLERVADDYEQVIKENTALREQIEPLEAQLAIGSSTKKSDDSEAVARRTASEIISEAKKKADSVVQEARKEAGNLIRRAEDEARESTSRTAETAEETTHSEATKVKQEELVETVKMEEMELRREISRLQGQKERFLIEYRELLEKHLKILTARIEK